MLVHYLLYLPFAFWNFVTSIPCSLFCLRFSHSEIMLPQFHVPCFVNAFYILHSEIMLPRFHVPCFVNAFYILHFTSWNYVASIPCSLFIYATSSISSPLFSFFYLAFLLSTFCILYSEMLSPRFYDRYLHSTLWRLWSIPRKFLLRYFHRIRTRWPGNDLGARL